MLEMISCANQHDVFSVKTQRCKLVFKKINRILYTKRMTNKNFDTVQFHKRCFSSFKHRLLLSSGHSLTPIMSNELWLGEPGHHFS